MTRRTRPLALDCLESRLCPFVDLHVTASAVVLLGTQGVSGDSVFLDWGGADQLTVTYSTPGGDQIVNFTGKTQAVVKLAGLNDTVTVRLSAEQTKPVKVTAELGGGDDSFMFGVSAGVVISHDVRLYVKGESGNDRVVLRDSPNVVGASFLVRATLGSGDDTFVGSVGALNATPPPEFQRLGRADFLVNGGDGDDGIHVLAGGPGLTIGGGTGPASELHGSLNVLVRGGSGDDMINVDSSYMDAARSRARVFVDGEAGNDVIVADLERQNGVSVFPITSATVRGGSGDDDLTLSFFGDGRPSILDGGTGVDIGFTNTLAVTVTGCEFV
jgi:hypothetical protein